MSNVAIAGDRDTDCWWWTGTVQSGGYGMLRFAKQILYAHRAAYEALVGPIPEGAFVLHSCDNPKCCNPNHLRTGTRADNSADMYARGRQGDRQYPKGSNHPLSKLTEESVRYIKAQIAAGAPKMHLARELGVSQGAILDIAAGRTWAWLT